MPANLRMPVYVENRNAVPIRVTNWGILSDANLIFWFHWLRGKKIPAAVISDPLRGEDLGYPIVSVWRIGEKDPMCREKIKPSYKIVEQCHGFAGIVGSKDANG